MSRTMSVPVGETQPSVPSIAQQFNSLSIPSVHPRSIQGGNPTVGILESASNVMISGGSFTAVAPPQASVTVNIHPDRAQDYLGDYPRQALSEEQHYWSESSPNISPNPSGPLGRTEDAPVREAGSSNTASPVDVRGQKSSPEIYRKHLGKPQVRGRPLWIPQPNSRLPKEYRAQGALIGDVGIFTPEGGFDFLFNILRSSTDPMNPRKLPQEFSPLDPPLNDIDIRTFKEFGKRSYLSSSSVSQVQGGTSIETGTIFESSAAEGAILIMPDGATLEELSNIPIFHEYIKKNAESFYDYANNVRGRRVNNGQLHVVYGCRKTTSWGIATFSNTSSQSNLRLQFLSSHGAGKSDDPISWEHRLHSGTADVKVGPDPEENEGLQGTEDGRKLNNQCLFASTLSIRLGDNAWKKRNPKKTVEVRDTSDCENDSPNSSTLPSSSQPSSQGQNNSSSPSHAGSRQRPRRGHNRPLECTSSSTDQPPSEREWEDVILEQSSPSSASVYHSEILTEYLLKMVPNADLAIASDKDWTDFIPFDDPAALIQNVCSMNNIREKDGVAFFEPKIYTAPKEDINEIMKSLDTGKFDLQQYLFGSSQNRDTVLNVVAHSIQSDSDFSGVGPDLPSILALAGHPQRLLSLDQIMDYHGHTVSSELFVRSILQFSVQELRDSLRKHWRTDPDSNRSQFIVQNLADALLNRFIGLSQQDDLDEAIWLFEHVLPLTPKTSYRYLEILLGLSTSLYARFQLSRQIEDRKRLLRYLSFQRAIDLDTLLVPVKLVLDRPSPVFKSDWVTPMDNVERIKGKIGTGSFMADDPNANDDQAAYLGPPKQITPEMVYGASSLFGERFYGTFEGPPIARHLEGGKNPLNGHSAASTMWHSPLDQASIGLFNLNQGRHPPRRSTKTSYFDHASNFRIDNGGFLTVGGDVYGLDQMRPSSAITPDTELEQQESDDDSNGHPPPRRTTTSYFGNSRNFCINNGRFLTVSEDIYEPNRTQPSSAITPDTELEQRESDDDSNGLLSAELRAIGSTPQFPDSRSPKESPLKRRASISVSASPPIAAEAPRKASFLSGKDEVSSASSNSDSSDSMLGSISDSSTVTSDEEPEFEMLANVGLKPPKSWNPNSTPPRTIPAASNMRNGMVSPTSFAPSIIGQGLNLSSRNVQLKPRHKTRRPGSEESAAITDSVASGPVSHRGAAKISGGNGIVIPPKKF